jgi:hypothetical protein
MNADITAEYSWLRRCIYSRCFVGESESQAVLSVNKWKFKITHSEISCTDLPKFLNLQTHSRCQNCDWKQTPYWGPTCLLRCHRTYLVASVICSLEFVRSCITLLFKLLYYKFALLQDCIQHIGFNFKLNLFLLLP